MSTDFCYFSEILPNDMYLRTKSYICKYMAIFEPEEYALDKVIAVDDYHFILFFSKPPVTVINNHEYQLKKGGMIVVQPWEEVYGVPGEKSSFDKYIHIAVKKDFFHRVASEITDCKEYIFKQIQSTYSKQLLDLIGNFQREMMDYGDSYSLMIESICIQIVFQLIRDLNLDTIGDSGKLGKENKYIDKAIQFMQEYYNANISIKDICKLIYLSPCHFKRVFKDYTGQTPYHYLMGIRLKKAKEMIRKNENSIEEVAKLCGFINPGHFSTAFKRNVKMSPTEFRKIAQNAKTLH